MRGPLREWIVGRELDRTRIPSKAGDFLRQLEGPAVIRLAGRDTARTRVVTTLLHANEPSGLDAVMRFLRSGRTPATNVLIFIGAVGSALTPPEFGHRALPGRQDANRVWRPPFSSPEGQLAREVLDVFRASTPEFLVDLHNNTGHNPAYGVTFGVSLAELSLVSLFADLAVHTPIELHTLVEATQDSFPSVTIECGRAFDPAADEAAWRGLERYLTTDTIDVSNPPRGMTLLGAPVRVSLAPDTDLSFGDRPDPTASITISEDIDRHNFETLEAGTAIGWVKPDASWPLHAIGNGSEECSRALFEVVEGMLRTRRDFIPVMMTTNREIARSDCLFYAVQRLALLSGIETPEDEERHRIGLLPEEAAWWR